MTLWIQPLWHLLEHCPKKVSRVDFGEAISRLLDMRERAADEADREAITTIVAGYFQSAFYSQEDIEALRKDVAETKEAAKDAAENSKNSCALVKAHFIPPSTEYKVSTFQLSQMLERLNARKSSRTIERWEKYIKTDGEEGSPPQCGYNLQTRTSLESATAWAQSFAQQDNAKMRTKISFERRFGGRQ